MNKILILFLLLGLSFPPNPVPEPATVLLVGLGIFGFAWFGRQRLKK